MVDRCGFFHDLRADGAVATLFAEYSGNTGYGLGVAVCFCRGTRSGFDFADDFWIDGRLPVQCAEIARSSLDGGCGLSCVGICFD